MRVRLPVFYGRGSYDCGRLVCPFADTILYSIIRSYGTDIEAQWDVGKYVLPGNVEKVILKPKQHPKKALTYLLASMLRETEFPLVLPASESRDP